MTLAHLLAATLLLCSLSAFAQDQQVQNSQPSARPGTWVCTLGCAAPSAILRDKRFVFDCCHHNAATASEPWKIFPDPPHSVVSGQTRPDQTPADQLKLEVRVRQLLESQIDRLSEEGPTCYAIRSYVVARDSKDSDSTHLAGYSTCQPATRYGLKTTEIRSATADR
jgi:hypothetical protein